MEIATELNCYAISAEDEQNNVITFTFTASNRRDAVLSFNEEICTLKNLNASKNKHKEYVIVDIKEVVYEPVIEIDKIQLEHLKCH